MLQALKTHTKKILNRGFGITEEDIMRQLVILKNFIFARPLSSRQHLGVYAALLGLRGQAAEIGVSKGTFSEVLLNTGIFSCVYSIDPWAEYSTFEYKDSCNIAQEAQETIYNQAVARLRKFGEKSKILRMTSEEAAKHFAESDLDFIYIDANHSYEACKEDLELWWPKLRRGGIFAGHDYVDGGFPTGVYGVKQAVDEFVDTYRQRLYIIPDEWPTWYLIKE